MFGPCFNVGHCNRSVCPYQHVDDQEDIRVKNYKGKIRVSDQSKSYSLRRKNDRKSSLLRQLQQQPPKKTGDRKDDEVVATGLRNLGNSCYVNATLQALANATPFAESLMRRKEKIHADKGERRTEELLDEITRIVEKLKKGETQYETPTQIIETVKKLSEGKFGNGNQEDAHEFLMFMLETIHEENIEGESITEEIFTGERENKLQCTRCKKERNGFPNPVKFNCRYIDIPPEQKESITLEECIKYTYKEEQIQADCPQCKGENAWRKSSTIPRYPTCQIVQLKRFEEEGKKNKRLVHLPLELENMNLLAVIEHIGYSQRSGHYTTKCWNEFKQKWCLFDDMYTKDIGEDWLSTENAYIAIYSFTDRSSISEKGRTEQETLVANQPDDDAVADLEATQETADVEEKEPEQRKDETPIEVIMVECDKEAQEEQGDESDESDDNAAVTIEDIEPDESTILCGTVKTDENRSKREESIHVPTPTDETKNDENEENEGIEKKVNELRKSKRETKPSLKRRKEEMGEEAKENAKKELQAEKEDDEKTTHNVEGKKVKRVSKEQEKCNKCQEGWVGFEIMCDECEEWFHGKCVGIQKREYGTNDVFNTMMLGPIRPMMLGPIRKENERQDTNTAERDSRSRGREESIEKCIKQQDYKTARDH